VPAIAETHRVYRPDLLGCGVLDQLPDGDRYTPETIGAQILAGLDARRGERMQSYGTVRTARYQHFAWLRGFHRRRALISPEWLLS
jgi:hypothetical protein